MHYRIATFFSSPPRESLEEFADALVAASPSPVVAHALTISRRTSTMTFPRDEEPIIDRTIESIPWGTVGLIEPFGDDPELIADAAERLHASLAADATCLVDNVQHFGDASIPMSGSPFLWGFLRRQDGLTREQFDRHWRDTHVPLALTNGAQFNAYTTMVTVASFGSFDWDGLVFDTFDSPEKYQLHLAVENPNKKAAFDDNVRGFSEMQLFYGEDHVIARR